MFDLCHAHPGSAKALPRGQDRRRGPIPELAAGHVCIGVIKPLVADGAPLVVMVHLQEAHTAFVMRRASPRREPWCRADSPLVSRRRRRRRRRQRRPEDRWWRARVGRGWVRRRRRRGRRRRRHGHADRRDGLPRVDVVQVRMARRPRQLVRVGGGGAAVVRARTRLHPDAVPARVARNGSLLAVLVVVRRRLLAPEAHRARRRRVAGYRVRRAQPALRPAGVGWVVGVVEGVARHAHARVATEANPR